MAEQWFSIVEYARTFQLSDMTVRRRIKTGRLHAVLKEGKYFIPVSAAEGRYAPPPEPHYAEMPQMQQQMQPQMPQQKPQQSQQQQQMPLTVPKRLPNEMMVIKGHPSAHKTYQTAMPAAPAPEPRSMLNAHLHAQSHSPQHSHHQNNDDDAEMNIPQSLRRSLNNQETSLVDTRTLLAFCEATMRKLGETERRQVEKFKSKLETLEAQVATKDLEVKQLRQQLEDLQLLVKFLDTKKKSG